MTASSGALARIPVIGDALKPWTGKKHQEQRRLTLPLSNNVNEEDREKLQMTNAQSQSAFFRMLPPEVRENIYLHYFLRETVHRER